MTIFWRFCVGFKKITLHIPVLVGTHTELWITPNMSQSQQASGTSSGYSWQERVFLQPSLDSGNILEKDILPAEQSFLFVYFFKKGSAKADSSLYTEICK